MYTRVVHGVGFIAIAAVALLGVPHAAAGGRPLTADLTGAAEAPGPGDPDGSGTAVLTINPGQREVCFLITVSGITLPAIAAHIHEAPIGVPGPVVVTLVPPAADGTAAGCVTADREELIEILHEPEEYYVNVHTTDFPAGAVRGQLSK